MTAKYDMNAYSAGRTGFYHFTARYFFGTIFKVRNHLKVEGRENLPEGSFVCVANHLSNWDPPLVSHVTDRPVAFLAKEELFESPIWRPMILTYGAIAINREHPQLSTFKVVKKMFAAGWSLGMFIEGTRSKTPGILGMPHTGPAYFAHRYKLPLVPIGLIGTSNGGGDWHARIGKPLEAGEDLDETTWRIMDAISELTGFSLPERNAPSLPHNPLL